MKITIEGDENSMRKLPQKFVVSRTLENPIWRNTTPIRDNVIESVRELKGQQGRTIITDGAGPAGFFQL